MGTIIYKKKDAAMTVTENRMLPCDINWSTFRRWGIPQKSIRYFPRKVCATLSKVYEND